MDPFFPGDLCRFKRQFLHQPGGFRIIQELTILKSGQSGQGIDPCVDQELPPHLVMDIRGGFRLDSCLIKHLSNPVGSIGDSMIQFPDKRFPPSGMSNAARL
jgi:hypothetical protein